MAALDHVVIGLNCQAVDEGLEIWIADIAFRQHANAIGEQIGNAHDLEDAARIMMDVYDDLRAGNRRIALRPIDVEEMRDLQPAVVQRLQDMVAAFVHRTVEEHVDILDRGVLNLAQAAAVTDFENSGVIDTLGGKFSRLRGL